MKKNKKDMFGFGKAINTNVINELSKKDLDKVFKILYDYDGDCNYCDDSNCSNGECKSY